MSIPRALIQYAEAIRVPCQQKQKPNQVPPQNGAKLGLGDFRRLFRCMCFGATTSDSPWKGSARASVEEDSSHMDFASRPQAMQEGGKQGGKEGRREGRRDVPPPRSSSLKIVFRAKPIHGISVACEAVAGEKKGDKVTLIPSSPPKENVVGPGQLD